MRLLGSLCLSPIPGLSAPASKYLWSVGKETGFGIQRPGKSQLCHFTACSPFLHLPFIFPGPALFSLSSCRTEGSFVLTGSRQTYWDTNKSTAPPVYLIQEVPNVRRGAQEPGLRDNQSLETQQSHQGSRSRGIRTG